MTKPSLCKSIAASLMAGSLLCLAPATFAADYDLAINGGRVMDPSAPFPLLGKQFVGIGVSV